MKRLLKIVAWALGALLLLLLVAIISLPLIIDPNDYRDEIGALVHKETGRELVIRGDLKLSIFPWLGVNVGESQLSNAPGFGPAPFAQFDHAKVAVRLLPLLFRQEVELDGIELDKLRLHLGRDRDGRTNWDDLVAKQQQAPTEPGAKKEPTGARTFRVGGIRVRDAQVTWEDKLANRTAEVGNLNLSTGALDLTGPVKLDLDADFASSAPQAAGHLSLKGTLHHDEAARRYRTEGLTLKLDAHGDAVPGGATKVTLTGDGAVDLKAQTAEVKNLHLDGYGARLTLTADAAQLLGKPDARGNLDFEVQDPKSLSAALADLLPPKFRLDPRHLAKTRVTSRFEFSLGKGTLNLPDLRADLLGLHLTADARGQGLPQAPRFTGQCQVAPFVPRDLMQALGIAPPATRDATALAKAAFGTRFDAGLDHATLDNLTLRLDQSTITGRAAAQRFAPLVLRYDLTLDQIDVDRYLPPPSKEPAPKPAAGAPAKPVQLPTQALRALDIDGTFRIGQLKAADLRSTNVLATLQAKGGQFRVHPASAQLYGGRYAGDVGLDVRSETPRLDMNEELTGIQLGPLLKDFMGKPYVTGVAQLNAQLTAQGLDSMQIRRTLTGKGAFNVKNGAVNGINLGQLLRTAMAKYKGQPAPPEETRQTDFAELRGTVTASDGLITNKDLTASSPLLRVNGQGNANLVNEKIDYRVNTTVVSSFEGQGSLAALKGTTVPVRITGTFGQPQFGVDVGAVLQNQAQQALQGQAKKAQKDLQKQLENQFKGLLKK